MNEHSELKITNQKRFLSRETTVLFHNNTPYELKLINAKLEDGSWSPAPPSKIMPYSSVSFRSYGSTIFTGTSGYAKYKVLNIPGEVYFMPVWKNPFFGSNSYQASVAGNHNGKLTSKYWGGDGDKANISMEYSLLYNIDYNNWMTSIHDDKLISLISIPGTHNSCARHGGGDPFALAVCQDDDLESQLNGGIRFLDIRCKVIDGVFAIHHGPIYQKMNFGDVLNQCIGFLKSHPRETIIMRVKQEESQVSDAEFINIFNNHYAAFHSKLYLGKNIPKLKDVRGKIVIFSNVQGLPGISWGGMNVQDEYDASYAGKIFSINSHISKVKNARSNGSKEVFINFISRQGIAFVSNPRSYSNSFNPELMNILNKNNISKPIGIGIFPMDFPSATYGLIPRIIITNYL